MLNLLRDGNWFADAATDRVLLETVESHGDVLEAKLVDMAEEYSEQVPKHYAETQLENWWISLDELIEAGLVRNKAPKEYALTHEGRVQLHSIRAAERQQESLDRQQESLDLGLQRLRIAVWALGATAFFGLVNIVLQLFD